MIVTPFAQVCFPYAPCLTCLIAVNDWKQWLISAVNLSHPPVPSLPPPFPPTLSIHPPGVGQPTNRKKQLHHPRQCHNTH